MRLNTGVIALGCLMGSVKGSFITTDIFTQAADLVGDVVDTTIASGALFSVADNAASTFLDINNQGNFFLTGSASDSASVTIGGDAFVNSGITSCDSSMSPSGLFTIQPASTFDNSGSMFLGLGEVAAAAVGFTITAASSWCNSGMLVLKASGESSCSADLGGTTISNEGSICLYSTLWSPFNSIEGSGCIAIHESSTFTTAADSCTIPSSQTIHLGAESSVFSITGFAASFGSLLMGSAPAYTVSGFGGGNTIEVDFSFSSYNYDSDMGILTLSGLFNSVSFNIGTGYDEDCFETNSSLFGLASNSICYNNDVPNEIPPSCSCQPNFPAPPSSTVSSSTRTSTSTLSAAKPSTFTVSTSTSSSSKVVPSSTSSSSKVVPSSTSSSTKVTPSSTSSRITAVPSSTASSSSVASTSTDGDDSWT